MLSKSEIIPLIYSAIDAVNQDLPADGKVDKLPSTRLLDQESRLDSLGFINFTMALEKLIRQKQGVAITLVTQETMLSEQMPLQTVDKLAEYIAGLNLGK